MDPQPQIERRRHRRINAITEIHCGTLAGEQLFVTRDLSAGGAFLTTEMPLPADSQVLLSFRLRPGDPRIACSGKVVYSKKGLGMGIQFFDVAGDLERALKDLASEEH